MTTAVELPGRTKVMVLAGALLGLLVAALDQTVVSTALPRIIGELGGLSLFSWVFTAYMLTSTITVPIAGKLSDLYGRKPFFMAGVALFMTASILAGISQTMLQLIIFRGLQGVGAGMIIANSFAIIGDLFPPSERGKYIGLFSGVFGIASIIGPTLGGFITDNLSWRWVFYVNIPVGIVALTVLWFGFPWVRARDVQRSIDYWGVAGLILAVVPLLLAFVWGGDLYPWASPQILGLLAAAAGGIILFIWAERRAVEPIMPLSMFQNRIFAVATLLTFLAGIGMFGAITFMPLFVQGALGASATNSGVITTPMMLGVVVASAIAGQLVARLGRYRLLVVAGALVLTAGMFLMTRMDQNTPQLIAVRNMVIIGVGIGLQMPILILAVQNALPYRLLGAATASNQFFRQIGGTLGVAIFGTIVATQMKENLRAALPSQVAAAPDELVAQLEDPQILLSPTALDRLRESFGAIGGQGSALFEATLEAMRGVVAAALTDVFFVGTIVALIALAVSVFLPDVPLRTTIETPEPAAPVPPPVDLGAAAIDPPEPQPQAPPVVGDGSGR